MKHPHAEFIEEALKDTSRKIEGKLTRADGYDWTPKHLDFVLRADGDWQFRFADTKPECVSPLTDEELLAIVQPFADRREPLVAVIGRAIANAAHRAAYKQVAELPAVSSLTNNDLANITLTIDRRTELRSIANAAIAEFQRTLLKQIGE